MPEDTDLRSGRVIEPAADKMLLASVRKIQSQVLEVMAGFIVGFDRDPEDIFERQSLIGGL